MVDATECSWSELRLLRLAPRQGLHSEQAVPQTILTPCPTTIGEPGSDYDPSPQHCEI